MARTRERLRESPESAPQAQMPPAIGRRNVEVNGPYRGRHRRAASQPRGRRDCDVAAD